MRILENYSYDELTPRRYNLIGESRSQKQTNEKKNIFKKSLIV